MTSFSLNSGWYCPPPDDPPRKVRFRCSELDKKLGPSLRPGNIIEIFGEAGSAKVTIFCKNSLKFIMSTIDFYF